MRDLTSARAIYFKGALFLLLGLLASGLLLMGGLYMYVGSALYIWQVVKLRRGLRMSSLAVSWCFFRISWTWVGSMVVMANSGGRPQTGGGSGLGSKTSRMPQEGQKDIVKGVGRIPASP